MYETIEMIELRKIRGFEEREKELLEQYKKIIEKQPNFFLYDYILRKHKEKEKEEKEEKAKETKKKEKPKEAEVLIEIRDVEYFLLYIILFLIAENIVSMHYYSALIKTIIIILLFLKIIETTNKIATIKKER